MNWRGLILAGALFALVSDHSLVLAQGDRDQYGIADAVAESLLARKAMFFATQRLRGLKLRYDVILPEETPELRKRIKRSYRQLSQIVNKELAFVRPKMRQVLREVADQEFSEAEMQQIVEAEFDSNEDLSRRFVKEAQLRLDPLGKAALMRAVHEVNATVPDPYE